MIQMRCSVDCKVPWPPWSLPPLLKGRVGGTSICIFDSPTGPGTEKSPKTY